MIVKRLCVGKFKEKKGPRIFWMAFLCLPSHIILVSQNLLPLSPISVTTFMDEPLDRFRVPFHTVYDIKGNMDFFIIRKSVKVSQWSSTSCVTPSDVASRTAKTSWMTTS